MFRFRIIALILLACALPWVVACSKEDSQSSSDTLSASAYREAATETLGDVGQFASSVEEDWEAAYERSEDEPLSEDDIESMQRMYDGHARQAKYFVKTYDEFSPPSEYEDIHDDILSGLSRYADFLAMYASAANECEPGMTPFEIQRLMYDGAESAVEQAGDDLDKRWAEAVAELGLRDEFSGAPLPPH